MAVNAPSWTCPWQEGEGEPFVPTADYLRRLAWKQDKEDVIAGIFQSKLGSPDEVADYVHRVLQHDIYELIGVWNVVKFYSFMRTIARMNGMVVNYVRIADSVDVTPNTIKQWVKFLEGTGMIYMVQSVDKVANKRLIKPPKLFFRDTAEAS